VRFDTRIEGGIRYKKQGVEEGSTQENSVWNGSKQQRDASRTLGEEGDEESGEENDIDNRIIGESGIEKNGSQKNNR
jgi:hypothetical protein